jgi:hypothetical protein
VISCYTPLDYVGEGTGPDHVTRAFLSE